MRQVAAVGRRRLGPRPLDEVARGRVGGLRRVFQPVAGGHRQREDLVGPDVLVPGDGQADPEESGQEHEQGEHPRPGASSTHHRAPRAVTASAVRDGGP